MLGRVKLAQADALESPAVGEGMDVRFETDRITGAALHPRRPGRPRGGASCRLRKTG